MPTLERLRGDLCVVEVKEAASRRASRILITPDMQDQRTKDTHVYWGVLKQAGPGRIGTRDGRRAPGILECPGFEEGVEVLCIRRFNHAATALGKDTILIHDFDVLACIGEDGSLYPSWGWSILDSPTPTAQPRQAREGSQILIVDRDLGYLQRPVTTGHVVRAAAILREKKETVSLTGKMAEYIGTEDPAFESGDRVLYKRFSGWRFFINEDDNLIIVPTADIQAIVPEDAEITVTDVDTDPMTGRAL